MTKTSQKIKEQQHYKDFATHCSIAPDGQIEFSDKPDVLVTRNGQRVGIEITSFFIKPGEDSSSDQRQQDRRQSVIREAASLFRTNQNPKYEFHFDFDPDCPIEGPRQAVLPKLILDCVMQAIEHKREVSTYPDDENCPELRFMYCNGVEYDDPKWQLIQGYDVPDLSIERLRQIIADKTEAAQEYQPCDRYWLLLIVDFWDPSQDQNIPETVAVDLEKTPFERIIIYKLGTRQCKEIQVRESV